MKAKWIFFDLDDTLFDFTLNSLLSLKNLYNEDSDLQSLFSNVDSFLDAFHFHNSRMWHLHEKGLISATFLKGERFRASVFPYRFDSEALDKSYALNDRYLHLLGLCPTVVPGAIELLESLKGRYLIGVLTNGFTEVQYLKLRSTGLWRYVQRMVISDEIGIQKPDPRLFRYAENAVGASAEDIIMVGDNPSNDVQGAINAGWKAIWFDRRGRQHEFSGESPLKVSSLEELANLL